MLSLPRAVCAATIILLALVMPAGAQPKGKESLSLDQAVEMVKKQLDEADKSLKAEWPKLARVEALSPTSITTVGQRKKVADLLKIHAQKEIDYLRLQE